MVAENKAATGDFLKDFAKFTEKHLRRSLFFLIKLQAHDCNFILKETQT